MRPPKVLITTSYKPTGLMYQFLSEVLELLPAAEYYKRNGFPLKKIVQFCNNREYTDILVFNEERKLINGMMHIHLPDGPTAQYRCAARTAGSLWRWQLAAGVPGPHAAQPPAPHVSCCVAHCCCCCKSWRHCA